MNELIEAVWIRRPLFILTSVCINTSIVVSLRKTVQMKDYDIPDDAIDFESVGDMDVFYLMRVARKGLGYSRFASLTKSFPFSMSDWSEFLHLSERTIQRYAKEAKAFDPVSSEKIIEITLLYKDGVGVFGNRKKFDSWLSIPAVALGGAAPKELLDSTMGIQLIRNELMRIEHGILA
jgi:putative toxin-antitoxin system antitoxin component (TIGR02293 family)